jgi:chromosome segregation ATPase
MSVLNICLGKGNWLITSRSQNQLLDEKSRSNEHFQESENLRLAAIQEAAYLRARLTAIESGSRDNITQLGTDRQQELEERLSAQLSAKAGLETQVGEAHRSLERLQAAVRQLEEEERRASDRATVAEQDCHSLRRELAELHSWKIEGDKTAREHANREISLSSTLQQHDAERTQFEEQLQRFQQERGEHMQLIEEAKQAMSAASEQAIHWQNSHATASQTIDQLQAEVARLKREADESRAEKEASIARSQDLEKAWNLSKQESASLRKLGDNRIQELLQTHRSTSSQDTSRGQREKFQAVSQECASLRKMLNEAGLQVSHAQSDAMQHRETVLRLEEEREHLRAELDTMKHSVRANHSELERVQQLASSREADAQRSKAKSADLEIRCAMLRNLLVDHGIATDEETETHTPNSISSVPSQLRSQLEDQAQQLKDSQNEILSLRRQLQDFSSREETLNRRLSVSRSPALGSAPFESLSSPATPQMPSRMAEDQADYHRMKQLEKDYREAVAYVK